MSKVPFKNDAIEKKLHPIKKGDQKTGVNGFQQTETVFWGLPLMNGGPKTILAEIHTMHAKPSQKSPKNDLALKVQKKQPCLNFSEQFEAFQINTNLFLFKRKKFL